MADRSSDALLESNADAVAGRLVAEAIDLDGSGRVALMRLLLSRAEEIKAIHDRYTTFAHGITPGGTMPDQSEFNAAFQEAFYDPVCLKWFLSRLLKRLSEALEYDVYESLQQLQPLKQIVFTEEGGVASYSIEPARE
jgi:hypothetical protein